MLGYGSELETGVGISRPADWALYGIVSDKVVEQMHGVEFVSAFVELHDGEFTLVRDKDGIARNKVQFHFVDRALGYGTQI